MKSGFDREAASGAGAAVEAGPGLPLRTCLGCREKRSQADMRRLALLRGGGQVLRAVWDDRRKLGGRGGWICRDRGSCLDLAVKKKAFNRAFRVAGFVDPRALEPAGEQPEAVSSPSASAG